jgi:hypothetical protein
MDRRIALDSRLEQPMRSLAVNAEPRLAQGESWNRSDTLLLCGSLGVGLCFLAVLLALKQLG